MWSLTTNPFRRRKRRWVLFQRNLARMRQVIEDTGGRFAFARTKAEYDAARARGAHAVFLGGLSIGAYAVTRPLRRRRRTARESLTLAG